MHFTLVIAFVLFYLKKNDFEALDLDNKFIGLHNKMPDFDENAIAQINVDDPNYEKLISKYDPPFNKAIRELLRELHILTSLIYYRFMADAAVVDGGLTQMPVSAYTVPKRKTRSSSRPKPSAK